jgi:hypothetical protein
MAIVQATSTRLKSLSIALTDLYTAFIIARLALLDHTTTHPDVRDYVQDPLPPRLARAATDTAGALERVRQTLLSVVDDDLALLCWEAAATRNGANALEGVGNSLRAHGFSPSEASIPILDIPYLAQFFTVAQGKLGELTFTPMLTAILATNASSIESVDKGYNNEALRSLVFGGNLLFSMMAPSRTQPGRQLVVSWGSAMLSDICKCIPDAEIVRAKLGEILPDYASSIAGFPISSPRVISSDLTFALAELEQRPELFVLELA